MHGSLVVRGCSREGAKVSHRVCYVIHKCISARLRNKRSCRKSMHAATVLYDQVSNERFYW